MRILTGLLCGLFLALSLNAQNTNAYVQVTAEDTLELEPEEIIFNIYVQDYPSDFTEITKSQSKLAASKKQDAGGTPIEKLSGVIKRMNIDTVPINTYFIQNDRYNSPKAVYSLRFSSKDRLKLFISQISEIKGMVGYIASLKSSNEQQAKSILTKRLLEKAEMDAKSIAQESKRTLGGIISVQEENIEKSYGGGWTMYPPLSAIAESYFSNPSGRDKIIISRRLLVRFLW